jgi:hypothetical protein
MINTCYTSTDTNSDWIFIDVQVPEERYEQFLEIRDDIDQIRLAIDDGWIVRLEVL